MAVFTLNSVLNFVISLLVAKYLGPAEYGRFVLALSASVVIQLLAFDWLRLAATRFYSKSERLEHTNVRATLDAAFGWLALGASLLAICVYAAGLDMPLSPELAALAIGASISNGLFDFACALLRARFLDRPYGALIVAKNLLAFALDRGRRVLVRLGASGARRPDPQRGRRDGRRARSAFRRDVAPGPRRPRAGDEISRVRPANHQRQYHLSIRSAA